MSGERLTIPPTAHNDALLHMLADFVLGLFNTGHGIKSNTISVGRASSSVPAKFSFNIVSEVAVYPEANADTPEQQFRVLRDNLTAAAWVVLNTNVSCIESV